MLAVGILNCGVQHENDPAYALLYDFVEKHDPVVRIGAIMGLGLAYAGTQKEEVCWSSSVELPPVTSLQLYIAQVMRCSFSVCTSLLDYRQI